MSRGTKAKGSAVDGNATPGELCPRTAELAGAYLASLPDRTIAPAASGRKLRAAFGGPLPEVGEEPLRLITEIAHRAEPRAAAGQQQPAVLRGGRGRHPAGRRR